MKKRKVMIIAVSALLVLSFVFYASAEENPDKKASAATGRPSVQETAEEHENGKVKKDEDKKASAAEGAVRVKAEKGETSTKASVARQTEPSSKQNSVKSKSTASDTKSTGGKGQSKQSETTKQPAHVHQWNPVYSERQVQKTKQIPWTKCYKCGADMTGNPSHIDQHLLNHETDVHYGTEYRTEVYYETETYLSGYRCSCGASK